VLDGMLTAIVSPVSKRFVRFLMVGALNSVVGYGIFAGLVFTGLMPEIALLIATMLGILFNFLTTGQLVFGRRHGRYLLKFVAVYGAVYALNAAALRMMMSLSIPPLVAQLILLPVAALLTYVALRTLVFKEDSL
jgi:putative flippase GtrA